MLPAPSGGLWEWFAGGSVGYLTDLETEMYGLHAGVEYRDPAAAGTHAIFLEVGYADDDARYSLLSTAPGGRSEWAAIDLDIIPITLNYKFEAPLTESLNYYLGAGVGIAILDGSQSWGWSQVTAPPNPFSGGGSVDDTEVRFYGHIFAGLTYNLSESFELFGGARYIIMDDFDVPFQATGAPSYSAGIDGDVLVELGVRFNF